MGLLLSQKAKEIIEKDAVSSYPYECCGFFYGTEKDEDREITIVRPVVNLNEDNKRRRFEIDPLKYLEAEQYALKHNITLLGVYHSHPDHPAKPSKHDLKYALPYFSYIIVSVIKGEVDNTTSWRINKSRIFEQESIIIQKYNPLELSLLNYSGQGINLENIILN